MELETKLKVFYVLAIIFNLLVIVAFAWATSYAVGYVHVHGLKEIIETIWQGNA